MLWSAKGRLEQCRAAACPAWGHGAAPAQLLAGATEGVRSRVAAQLVGSHRQVTS